MGNVDFFESKPKVIMRLPDGRLIARARDQTVYASGANKAVTVTIPDLKEIHDVLDVKFDLSPAVDMSATFGLKASGNVVGFTISNLAAGTTVTTVVDALGI